MEKVNRKVDKQMKEKYGSIYKTGAEKKKEAREAKKRYDVMQLIFLIQQLQTTNRLNEETRKFSHNLPSQFDKFL
ncbi:hypothetical protein ES703_56214 [subsurface metagenome]